MFILKDVNKVYNEDQIKVFALNDVSLQIEDFEKISIIGRSGSGKSTLLNVMSTIDEITSGYIEFNGTNLGEITEKEKSLIRLKDFGFVFQKYYLMPTLNILDNILLPASLSHTEIDKEYVNELLEELDIASQINKMPGQLSGGQQQRVAIARALIMKPQVVFADEPTGNLDSENSNNVIELLFNCADKYQQTLIYVTHNEELAAKADRIIHIKDGAFFA